MDNIDNDVAVIVSGPGKSPPVFNLMLEMAKKHQVGVAMVFRPGRDVATPTSLSWEAPYERSRSVILATLRQLIAQ